MLFGSAGGGSSFRVLPYAVSQACSLSFFGFSKRLGGVNSVIERATPKYAVPNAANEIKRRVKIMHDCPVRPLADLVVVSCETSHRVTSASIAVLRAS